MIPATSRCLDCIFNQAYRITRNVGMDEEESWRFLMEVMDVLSRTRRGDTPIHITRRVYDVLERFGYSDPFREIKRHSIELARELLSDIEKDFDMDNGLFEALKISAAGNALDFGLKDASIDILRDRFLQVMRKTLYAPDYEEFLRMLDGDEVLFIGDNAGESVLDTFVLRELVKKGIRVYYAVRHVPVINDVIYEDAVESGVNKYAEIVDSGSEYPGLVLEETSREFQELFRRCSVVISKGQGNLEGLYGVSDKVFFLLTAKCPHIAELLKVSEFSPVFVRNRSFSNTES